MIQGGFLLDPSSSPPKPAASATVTFPTARTLMPLPLSRGLVSLSLSIHRWAQPIPKHRDAARSKLLGTGCLHGAGGIRGVTTTKSKHFALHRKALESLIGTKHVCFPSTCYGNPGDFSNEQSKLLLVGFSSSHSFTNYICSRQPFIIINLKPLLAQKIFALSAIHLLNTALPSVTARRKL